MLLSTLALIIPNTWATLPHSLASFSPLYRLSTRVLAIAGCKHAAASFEESQQPPAERSHAGVFVFTRHFDAVSPPPLGPCCLLPALFFLQRCCSTDITKLCSAIYMQSRDEEQDINWSDSPCGTGRDLIGGCWLWVCSISLPKKKNEGVWGDKYNTRCAWAVRMHGLRR